MIYSFKMPDHPTANDRTPVAGDEAYILWFPTDDGGKVLVEMGREGMVHTAGCLLAMMRDDPGLQAEASAEAATILDEPVEFREAT